MRKWKAWIYRKKQTYCQTCTDEAVTKSSATNKSLILGPEAVKTMETRGLGPQNGFKIARQIICRSNIKEYMLF